MNPAARRRSRAIALQALYAWLVGGGSATDALDHAMTLEGWAECDAAFARELIRGVIDDAATLEAALAPCLQGRSFAEVSPVERAILFAAGFELRSNLHTPFKVVINEAIELGKLFGSNEGHRFVNGVLERLAGKLRSEEFTSSRRARRVPSTAD